MKHFTKLLVLTLLITGCAKKPDPITTINDGIQQDVAQLVDYAKNNMVMDTDKEFLLKGATDCAARADALTQTCTARIETCEAETGKAKAERNMLALILILLAANAIRKMIRV